MAGPYGRMCRNLFGESLSIKGKLIIDKNANLYVANAKIANVHVSGNVFTDGICEYEMGQGIMTKGNITMRNGDVFCADTIKANTIIGNIQGNLAIENIIASSVCGNILTDEIRGKNGNTIALYANLVLVPPGTAIISDSIFVNSLIENLDGGGINVLGNICQTDGYSIQTSKIEPKLSGNGVIIDTYIPKNRFGLGRVWCNVTANVDNGSTIQIPLLAKSFESTFTTTRNIIHPDGNTLVTFQSPSTANVNCEYTSALVRTNIVLAVKFNGGETNDDLVFTVQKNKTDVVSKFTHSLMGPCIDIDQTFAWSDLVSISPDDTLDLFVFGGNISGNLDAQIQPGATDTFVTFEIESFEV